LKLSENIAEVFLSESGELTVAEVLARSEHRGFGFLLVILTMPVALPFTPPGISTPFAVLVGILACQMMARRQQPWLPAWVMRKRVKTGDSRFLKAMEKWCRFFEKFLKPRMLWIYNRNIFTWFLGPLILLTAIVMALPFPFTNSASALAIFLIALGMLEDDGVMGIAGALLSLLGIGFSIFIIVMLTIHGPEGMEIVKRSIGR
jgi:hypothetical protein